MGGVAEVGEGGDIPGGSSGESGLAGSSFTSARLSYLRYISGRLSACVVKLLTRIVRPGSGRSPAKDVHRFLQGRPVLMPSAFEMCGSAELVQSYVDALCFLPNRLPAHVPSHKASQSLGPKNGVGLKGFLKGEGWQRRWSLQQDR